MSHLTLETIARLVDEAATVEETAHLDACEVCRAELDAMREDVQALSVLPDMAPPPDSWPALERRLEDEGLIVRQRRFAAFPPVAWAAAAAVVFLAGSLAGRLTIETGPQVATQVPATSGSGGSGGSVGAPAPTGAVAGAAQEPVQEQEPVQAPRATEPQVAAQTGPTDTEPGPVAPSAARPPAGVTLASSVFGGGAAQPRTLEEAATLLRQAEELYLAALTRYAELATQAEPGDPVSRLAALQSIVMTTQAALNQAPADPVINGYHLTALAQRDATLRQVAAASSDRWY